MYIHFYSRPCGRGDPGLRRSSAPRPYFYSRPCGRGDLVSCKMRRDLAISTHALREGRHDRRSEGYRGSDISTHAPAGGATWLPQELLEKRVFLLTPLREGRPVSFRCPAASHGHFYSRPCGRGDDRSPVRNWLSHTFLLTPLREGRRSCVSDKRISSQFLLTPLREGRRSGADHAGKAYAISTHAPAGGATPQAGAHAGQHHHFYSRPCGRGDPVWRGSSGGCRNFYSRPCGRGDLLQLRLWLRVTVFLLTPLREGRRRAAGAARRDLDFYSRPCGRGDESARKAILKLMTISTHAPAGGATMTKQGKFLDFDKFLLTPLREGRHRS